MRLHWHRCCCYQQSKLVRLFVRTTLWFVCLCWWDYCVAITCDSVFFFFIFVSAEDLVQYDGFKSSNQCHGVWGNCKEETAQDGLWLFCIRCWGWMDPQREPQCILPDTVCIFVACYFPLCLLIWIQMIELVLICIDHIRKIPLGESWNCVFSWRCELLLLD